MKTKCQSWIKIFFLRRRWISLWSTLHIWWKGGKKQIVFSPPRQTYLFNQPTTFPLVHTFACLTFTLRVDCTTKVFKLNNFILHTNRKYVNEMQNYFQQLSNSRFGLVTICSKLFWQQCRIFIFSTQQTWNERKHRWPKFQCSSCLAKN